MARLERSVDTDAFGVAQQPDTPLSRENDDTSGITDEDAVVCECWCHNNVLCLARMLPFHSNSSCQSVVCAFSPARLCLIADA